MNRLKAIVANINFLESPLASRVTHFSLCTPSPLLDQSHHFRFPNIHQKLYFSSKSNSIVELILTSDWSKGLERESEKCCPFMTHETALDLFFNWVSTEEWFRVNSKLYSLILRILATEETIKQFWITLWTMKRKKFYYDEEMYLPILADFRRKIFTRFYNWSIQQNASVCTKVVDIISRSEWGDEVMGELSKLKIHLSDNNFVIRVLKELRETPLKACGFFHWVDNQSGVLARTNSIEKLWRVVEEMKSAGHELDIETYIKLSRMLLKNKMLEDVVKLYELIMDGHCSYKPSVGDCLLLLKSISASDMPDLDLVFSFQDFYEIVNRAFSARQYMMESTTENVVNHMRNAGYEPDNTYIQSKACKVLEEMESCGCIPDIKIWTILIQGHCDANEIDRALLCLHETIEKGCKADAAVLGVLIDSFLSQKRIDDGYKLLVKIVRKHGKSPTQNTYLKLIDNLLEIGKFEEALDLLCLMISHTFTPFIDAVKFLKAWSKGSPQSRFAYLRVFKSLLGKGRHRESKYLLNRLKAYPFQVLCSSNMDGCVHAYRRLIPFLNPKTLKIAKANASAILLSGSAI
ncbi:hypothetical protein GLYMA_17G124200v4 [Glycine max]|uniref:Pentacotripeptide-repeat region of PRORP domain-containing protein n=1 Tax=Glycine max TaxID=3847 RepID=I1MUI7_SOYBN|nr:hypothetical protein GLYMA_17G124200v4 [Glycine max]